MMTAPLTVRELIRDAVGRMTPAENKVARAVLASYPMAGLETVAQLAAQARVSGPTVLRFAAKLGFDGHAAFQRRLRDEVQERMTSALTLYDRRTHEGGIERLIEESAAAFRELLDATFAELVPSELTAAVELMAAPGHRLSVTGGRFSDLLARYLEAHLRQLRPDARHLDPAVRMDRVVDFGRRDVVLVFDFRRYQKDTVQFALAAAKRGAQIVLVTDPWMSPIADVAKIVLRCRVAGPSAFDTSVAGMAVVEVMISALMERLGDGARKRIEAVEANRVGFAWGED
jgi:DNA-binding MurR/RpiR family transcriptional regulator